jgi:hypothetical protein
MKRCFTTLLLLLLAALPAHADPGGELVEAYKVKAALAYKLTKFVEWPAEAFESPDSPLGICLLGGNPFGETLNALSKRKVASRSITVRQAAVVEDAKNGCHLLFVSATPKLNTAEIVAELADLPILTISDAAGFAEAGGVIELVSKAKRIGFKINLDSAKRSGLRISSSLLHLSTVVQPAGGGE